MAFSTLQFLGAARTVTGSRFLVGSPNHRVLVDCGLFQGLKANRRRNWEPFPEPPAGIDAVVVTHAHIDHSGYLPALVRDGFRGRIVCTPETAELVQILLTDSAHLQEEEARFVNRVGSTKHSPALPLYTAADAELACGMLDPQPRDSPIELGGEMRCELRRAGHILGSATATLTLPDSRGSEISVLFSGDLGRPVHPILASPASPGRPDVVVIESTYGDRQHSPTADEIDRLADVIRATAGRGGTTVIPAFAVDRTEVVLHALHELERDDRIPEIPIYVDSPMALSVLDVYRAALERGGDELRPEVIGRDLFDPSRVTGCRTTAESKSLAGLTYPSIIISASGMATGGRVLHHLARTLPNSRNSVILTGFQAEGTRGDRLARGERSVKIFGRYVPVRADVEVIDGFSVHADSEELLAWLAQAERAPDSCYVVHGTEKASAALSTRIGDRLGWNSVVPRDLERVVLA